MFPVTQEHLQFLGLTVARCHALGWREVMVVDDFGNLVPFSWTVLRVSLSN